MIIERPKAAFICIGDEILSGRTQDTNLAYLGNWLNTHGVELAHARIVADDEAEIITAVRELCAKYTFVFSSGGIGSTHDDITAQSVASAFSRALIVDSRAVKILEQSYTNKGGVTGARMRMARMPSGSTLICTPNSGAPGFQVENLYVMAGVPTIFRAMLAGLTDDFSQWKQVWHSRTVTVYCGETTLADQLAEVQKSNPKVKIGSYPKYSDEHGHYVQLVFRGPETDAIQIALTQTKNFVTLMQIPSQDEGFNG